MNQKVHHEKEMFKNFANKCNMGCANHTHCIISAEQRAVCEPIFLSLALSAFLWLTLALSGSLTGSGSLWLALALFGLLSPSGSLCLCIALSDPHQLSLPLSGALWPFLTHYSSLLLLIYTVLAWLTRPSLGSQGPYSAQKVLTRLTRPLIGSQRCCHSDTLYPGLQQRYLLETKVRKSPGKKTFVLIPTHKTRLDVVVRMCTCSKLNDTPTLR